MRWFLIAVGLLVSLAAIVLFLDAAPQCNSGVRPNYLLMAGC